MAESLTRDIIFFLKNIVRPNPKYAQSCIRGTVSAGSYLGEIETILPRLKNSLGSFNVKKLKTGEYAYFRIDKDLIIFFSIILGPHGVVIKWRSSLHKHLNESFDLFGSVKMYTDRGGFVGASISPVSKEYVSYLLSLSVEERQTLWHEIIGGDMKMKGSLSVTMGLEGETEKILFHLSPSRGGLWDVALFPSYDNNDPRAKLTITTVSMADWITSNIVSPPEDPIGSHIPFTSSPYNGDLDEAETCIRQMAIKYGPNLVGRWGNDEFSSPIPATIFFDYKKKKIVKFAFMNCTDGIVITGTRSTYNYLGECVNLFIQASLQITKDEQCEDVITLLPISKECTQYLGDVDKDDMTGDKYPEKYISRECLWRMWNEITGVDIGLHDVSIYNYTPENGYVTLGVEVQGKTWKIEVVPITNGTPSKISVYVDTRSSSEESVKETIKEAQKHEYGVTTAISGEGKTIAALKMIKSMGLLKNLYDKLLENKVSGPFSNVVIYSDPNLAITGIYGDILAFLKEKFGEDNVYVLSNYELVVMRDDIITTFTISYGHGDTIVINGESIAVPYLKETRVIVNALWDLHNYRTVSSEPFMSLGPLLGESFDTILRMSNAKFGSVWKMITRDTSIESRYPVSVHNRKDGKSIVVAIMVTGVVKCVAIKYDSKKDGTITFSVSFDTSSGVWYSLNESSNQPKEETIPPPKEEPHLPKESSQPLPKESWCSDLLFLLALSGKPTKTILTETKKMLIRRTIHYHNLSPYKTNEDQIVQRERTIILGLLDLLGNESQSNEEIIGGMAYYVAREMNTIY